MMLGMFDLKHGDRVHFVDARGQERKGKVNGLLLFRSHCVLDMGGPHGTPLTVFPSQIFKVVPRPRRDWK
jgi:hypothetical protein